MMNVAKKKKQRRKKKIFQLKDMSFKMDSAHVCDMCSGLDGPSDCRSRHGNMWKFTQDLLATADKHRPRTGQQTGNEVARSLPAPCSWFCLSSGTEKYWTHFVQRVKGCILSNTFWDESQLDQGKRSNCSLSTDRRQAVRHRGKLENRRLIGQKLVSFELNTPPTLLGGG